MAAVVVGAVLAVVGTAATVIGQRKQRKALARAQAEEKKQRELANRQQALERQRQIRQTIAQQRVQRAQLLAASYGLGGGNSIAEGGSASIGQDTATAIGSSNTQMAAASGIAASQNRAADIVQGAQSNFFLQAAPILSAVGGGFSSGAFNFGRSATPASTGAAYNPGSTPLFGVAR